MHYVRGMVSHYMAAVAHVLEDKQQQAACYFAQVCCVPRRARACERAARLPLSASQQQQALTPLHRPLPHHTRARSKRTCSSWSRRCQRTRWAMPCLRAPP
jgi:hypothetical protein